MFRRAMGPQGAHHLGSLSVGRVREETERATPSNEILALPVTALTTAGVTLYTVPDRAELQIHWFMVTNFTGSAATFNMYLVPDGDSSGNDNIIYSAESVALNGTFETSALNSHVVPANTSIVVSASTNDALNILLSGSIIYDGQLM